MVGVNVLADRGRAALFTVPAELNVRDNAARTTYEGSCGSAGSAGHCGRGPGRSPYSNLSHSSPAVPPLWPDRDLRHVGTTQSAPQATRSPGKSCGAVSPPDHPASPFREALPSRPLVTKLRIGCRQQAKTFEARCLRGLSRTNTMPSSPDRRGACDEADSRSREHNCGGVGLAQIS